MFNRMEAFLFCPAEKYRQSPYQKALPVLYYPITDMLPYPQVACGSHGSAAVQRPVLHGPDP